MNNLELKTELKIVLYWIRSKAAGTSVGEPCQCGSIFGIADMCMTTPVRKQCLKDAPDWVQSYFPQYDFKLGKLKEGYGQTAEK